MSRMDPLIKLNEAASRQQSGNPILVSVTGFPTGFQMAKKLPASDLAFQAMAIRVVEFSRGGGTKLERFLHNNQHTAYPKEIIEF